MRTKLAAAALLTASLGHAQFGWQYIGDFPGTPRDDAAAFSHYCKVYVGTGMEVGWNLTNDWWQYDMVQWSWQQVASLPSTPRQYCTAKAIDGIGYLFGGLDANGPLNELWAYDTGSDTWSAKAALPGAGRYASVSLESDGRLYICGGLVAGGVALTELWEYDPTTDAWVQRADLPGIGRHRATAMNRGVPPYSPMVIGGADEAYNALSEVWQYNTADDSWQQLNNLPEGRYGSSSSFSFAPIVMAGAIDGSTFRSDGYTYNGSNDTWEVIADGLPDGRRGGVMGESHWCSGWYLSFYGLGLDQTQTRRNDWYFSGFWFGLGESDVASLAVHPNPATDLIHLGSDAMTGTYTLTLLDGLGQSIRSIPTWSASEPLVVSQLAPGPYVVRLAANGRIWSSRFIKLP
ncbi:MAG: T9SS type A sorting domain-containing protein [Flavobacteriales bacterium]|nr:T9SS type A sorting domain-containing protein [Flavobacteriales bacterium]